MLTDHPFSTSLGISVSVCKFLEFRWSYVFVLNSVFPQAVFAEVCVFYHVFMDSYLFDENFLYI